MNNQQQIIGEIWMGHRIVIDYKGYMHYDSVDIIKPFFSIQGVSIKPKYSCQKCQKVMEFEQEDMINPGYYPICEKCKMYAIKNNWGQRWQ